MPAFSTKLKSTKPKPFGLLPAMLLPPVLRSGLLNRLATVAAALAALVLLALLVAAILVWTRAMPPPLLPAPATIAAVDLTLAGNGDDAAGAMVARPLFWSERRPYVASAESSEQEQARGPDPFDKIRLVGIFAGGDAGGAIVDVDGQRQRVLLHDKLHGWQLTGIAADHITFTPADGGRGNGAARKLELEHAVVKGKDKARQQPAPPKDSPPQEPATDNKQATQQDSNE
ncbi:MAG: hypothetical protein WC247_16300 [Porticoccaceae bacterium]